MKHILVLDTGKEWGGGTNSLLELLKRADRAQFSFTVLFYHNYRRGSGETVKSAVESAGAEFVHLQQRKQPVFAKAAKELARALLFAAPSVKKRAVQWLDYAFQTRQRAQRIAEAIRSRDVALLYMNNQPSSNLDGILAAGLTGIPAIQHSRIEASLNRREVEAANVNLAKIICVSMGVKDSLVSQGIREELCTVVHNGIDANISALKDRSHVRSSYGVGEDEPLVIIVGSLVKRKRVADLFEALALLKSRHGVTPRCLVLGEGPEAQNLKKLAADRQLQRQVIFAGFQDDPLSPIGAADILVLASEKEGLPRVILEAMLMGRPVIAADIVGPSELVVHEITGLLVPLRSPVAIADAIALLMQDRSLRERMGSEGRARVLSEFSIERYVHNVEAVFGEVLGA